MMMEGENKLSWPNENEYWNEIGFFGGLARSRCERKLRGGRLLSCAGQFADFYGRNAAHGAGARPVLTLDHSHSLASVRRAGQ